jgi:drug/metabolite transporter (DMT)-like permease
MRNLIQYSRRGLFYTLANETGTDGVMISGVLYALLAGMMWGLIFVGPVLVPEYPAVLQSMGRYLALGLIALPLAGSVARDCGSFPGKTGGRRWR